MSYPKEKVTLGRRPAPEANRPLEALSFRARFDLQLAVQRDEAGRLVQVSFNNADRAPFLLPPDEMEAFYAALRAFEALANDQRLQWRRVNPPGEAMLFDNWRVLHGRLSYTGHRHLCGAYVNREDYESRLRTSRSALTTS